MAQEQSFWPVEYAKGEPDLWVCMSCLNEVFRRKVPMPDCPTCHGVSTYEAFALESILDWGTDDLIAKAKKAQQEVEQPAPEAGAVPSAEQAE